MDRGRFDELVERIEQRFDGRPEALTRHTWRWLLLGYGVVISLTGVLVGGGLAVFVLGVQMPSFGVLLVILGGILITFGLGQAGALAIPTLYEPDGRTLEPDEAPELRRLVCLLAEQIGSPVPDEILLTDDFNAAIVQHPRLGIFGWPKSWLILGVPLLLATSAQEIAAVTAHELGHLSKKHGRQGNRIYQMHQSWEKLFRKLRENSASGFIRFAGSLVLKFLQWYWPRFHARAFVLSRQNEFQADRLAAEATGPEVAAAALWRIDCSGFMLEHQFWKDLWRASADVPEPPTDLCRRLKEALKAAPNQPGADRWCDQALHRVSGHDETHPSLSERLTAIGVDPTQVRRSGFPPAPQISAAAALLGSELPQIETQISDEWRRSVMAIWRDRHRRTSAIRHLAEPEQPAVSDSAQSPPVSAAELWNQTRALLDAQGLDAAEHQLRRLLAVDPEHVGATFALGQLRLNQGHADGEDLLQHILSLQTPEWTQPAGNVLERHFTTTGQRDALKLLRQQLDDFERLRTDAEKERTDIRRSDAFVPHNLPQNDLSNLQTVLQNLEHCRAAWLVQKQLRHFPDERLYVLCVDTATRIGPAQRSERNDRLLTSVMMKAELPGRLFVVNPTGEFRAVARRLMKQDDWQIFERS